MHGTVQCHSSFNASFKEALSGTKLLVGHTFVIWAFVEAMPKFELLLLCESITLVLCYWSFDNMRGFNWKEILACVVEQGNYSLEVVCCLSFGFFYYSPFLRLCASFSELAFGALVASFVAEHYPSTILR